jgi:hypothetical protein
MDNQSSSQATSADPSAERQSNVVNEGNWTVERLPYTEDCPARGFLQLCADRRFHSCLQREFKKDAGLSTREDYWIHADAGGTPTMANQTVTPDYCYKQKNVRLMGWSAHGDNCGGLPSCSDHEIKQLLCETMQGKVKAYPEATHFIYFVTIDREQGKEETVLHRMIYQPGEAVVCTQGLA